MPRKFEQWFGGLNHKQAKKNSTIKFATMQWKKKVNERANRKGEIKVKGSGKWSIFLTVGSYEYTWRQSGQKESDQ